nr:cell wall-binding repeat-containing protein [Ornithinimicrobium sp. F0845]
MDELHRDPSYYDDGCHVGRAGTTVRPGCTYGVTDSEITVAVLGSSKIGQLFPALEEIALREGWSLRMYTKQACAFVKDAPPAPGYPECDLYNDAVRTHLEADPPDLVLTSGMRTDVAQGYLSAWRFLEDLGVEQIVALWDTPVPDGNPNTCIADALQNDGDLTECAMPLEDRRSGNPSLRMAASWVDSATFVNLRDWVCPVSELSPQCPAVVGRAQIYASGSHMSQGYAPTLTDPIHQRLYEAGMAQYRPSVDRVSGSDRYETAALLSRDVEPGGRVFVVSGHDYPDALAAAAKAGHTGGAVLLTQPTALPIATREALIRLEPSEIIVAGGPNAVSEGVLDQLRTLGPHVQRVAGTDRYQTAAEISRLAPVTSGGVVYVATGAGFADALAAAAQAGQRDAPILLVRPDSIPVFTTDALEELSPRTIIVAGGPGAVSDDVVAGLEYFAWDEVVRRGGADRYETAAALAEDTAPGTVLHVGVGSNFADSLAAAPLSAAAEGAVLLVPSDRVPGTTAQAIETLAPASIVLTGGTSAVSEETKRALIRLVPPAEPPPTVPMRSALSLGHTLR